MKQRTLFLITNVSICILLCCFILSMIIQCEKTDNSIPVYYFNDFIERKNNPEQKKVLYQIKNHQHNNMYETQKWLETFNNKYLLTAEDSLFSEVIAFKNTFLMSEKDMGNLFKTYDSLRKKVTVNSPQNYFLLLELDGVMFDYYELRLEYDSLFLCIEKSFDYLGEKEFDIVRNSVSNLYLNNLYLDFNHNHDWADTLQYQKDTVHFRFYYNGLQLEKMFNKFHQTQDTVVLKKKAHQILNSFSNNNYTISKVEGLRLLCYHMDYKEAEPYINAAIQLSEDIGYKNRFNYTLITKGHIEMQKLNYQSASDYYENALKLFSPNNTKYQQVKIYHLFAKGHISEENYHNSIKELQKIVDLDVQNKDYFNSNYALQRILWLHKHYKNTTAFKTTQNILDDYEKNVFFKEHKQDLTIKNLKSQISQVQLKSDIENVSKEKERNHLQVKNQRYFLIILSMFLVGAIVIIIIFFQRMKILKQLQIATTKLEHKNQHMKVLLQELANQKNKLEDANTIIEKSLNERNLALNRLQDATAVLSHDFKNPLNAIYQLTELIKLSLENNKTDEIQEYLYHISESSLRLNKMVEWLYSHSFQTLQIRKDMTDVDLNKTLQQVTLDLKMMMDEKDATMKINPLPIIRGHDILVHQIFQNLISNSLKYSDPNRPPVIEIWSETLEDYFAIYVKDNGIGIPKDHISKVFEKQYQVDTHEDEKKGMGLGLNTCREIIEMLSGKIEIESTVGEETTIIIYFPIVN